MADRLFRNTSPHREFMRRYRVHFSAAPYRRAAGLSILFFATSVAVSFFAIQYATERASNAVTDIVLSNIGPFDVDAYFVFGTLLLIAFTTLLLLAHPKRIPFVLNALGLFYLIRSAFVTMTHLGPFPIPPDTTDWGVLAAHFLFGADRFFSAHTGVPFLLALIFWRERGVRNTFLAWSAYMALVVLLGHYHYTIDVASAFFITYTIFVLAERFFPRSHAIFLRDESHEL